MTGTSVGVGVREGGTVGVAIAAPTATGIGVGGVETLHATSLQISVGVDVEVATLRAASPWASVGSSVGEGGAVAATTGIAVGVACARQPARAINSKLAASGARTRRRFVRTGRRVPPILLKLSYKVAIKS